MAPDEKLIRSGAAGFQKKLRLYNRRKKIKNDPIVYRAKAVQYTLTDKLTVNATLYPGILSGTTTTLYI
jgi:hypothetical protein